MRNGKLAPKGGTHNSKKYAITALAYNAAGRLIAVGKNSYTKTHPLQAKLAKLAGNPEAIYLHAEIAALVKAREPVARLVVLRYDRRGNPACAKPCKICMRAIKLFNIKHVEHT